MQRLNFSVNVSAALVIMNRKIPMAVEAADTILPDGGDNNYGYSGGNMMESGYDYMIYDGAQGYMRWSMIIFWGLFAGDSYSSRPLDHAFA